MERLVEIWGSIAGVARALELPYPTVQAWARRGVPGKRFVEVIKAAREAGHTITLSDLAADTEIGEDAA